ncbi:hypothetical protein [Noviherbaspirillum sedimenti]|nr:hypothetical protein [Noviherbaspirillum sedimenti]
MNASHTAAPTRKEGHLPRLVMAILWSSFLMACVSSGVLFSLVDPVELVLLDSQVHLSQLGTYTVGFFLFWFLGAISSALTALLLAGAEPT